ncbi:IclR family transcriptional regulator [Jannaschia helgolandensis]|uniref:Transcriptional regulator, IclR family n=1 Tax=Jannaschia helgolandensis TaxID=188906 RepID=A0A1H7IIP7_9RHOB|nr:IclR family transcriptional regulator [Jannaschia helgolandensis]SEK62278.1 transcriptional regulator, IclR family [Jannaschia helgolandensis]
MNIQTDTSTVTGRDGSDGTVGKALGVLDRVAAFGRPVRFTELLEVSPFPKATLYRLLQTLTKQGMLGFDPERGTYVPGLRLVRMAHAAWAQSSLAPIARSHLDRLSRAVGETVHLAQLDGGHVLYVDKRNAVRPVPMYSEAGKIGPAYCTGVGKAMLAFLPEAEREAALVQQSWHRFTPNTLTDADAMRAELDVIRTEGNAFDREEHEPGIHCIAMPVLSQGGRVLGAVSVTSSTDRGTLENLKRHLPHLRQAVDRIAGEVRDWRFPDQTEG